MLLAMVAKRLLAKQTGEKLAGGGNDNLTNTAPYAGSSAGNTETGAVAAGDRDAERKNRKNMREQRKMDRKAARGK